MDSNNLTGPIIWGGPIPRSFKFRELSVVFVERLNRHGTIVSGKLYAGQYGMQSAVIVEFESGEGLPGNDPVQTVALMDLRPPLLNYSKEKES